MDQRVQHSICGRWPVRSPQIIYRRTKHEHNPAVGQAGMRVLICGTGAAALAAAFEAEGCIVFTNGPERRVDGSRHIDGPLLPLLRRGWGVAIVGLTGAYPRARRLMAAPVPQMALLAAPATEIPGFRPPDQTLRQGHAAGPAMLRLWLKDLPRLQSDAVPGGRESLAGLLAGAWGRQPDFSIQRMRRP